MRCRGMIHLMDSGACEKMWRNPDLHINEIGRRKFFLAGNSGFFQVVANSGKMLFYQIETKRKTFFKFQNPGHPRLLCNPFPTPMQTRIMYTYGKPRLSRNELTRFPHKLGLCNRNPHFRLRLRPHHLKVSCCGSSCNHPKLFGLELRLHSPSLLFFDFAIILPHYNAMLYCNFCVMSCGHAFFRLLMFCC